MFYIFNIRTSALENFLIFLNFLGKNSDFQLKNVKTQIFRRKFLIDIWFLIWFYTNLLTGESLKALFDLSKRAFAKLTTEQIMSDAFIVRKASNDLLGRDEEIGRYDQVVRSVAAERGLIESTNNVVASTIAATTTAAHTTTSTTTAATAIFNGRRGRVVIYSIRTVEWIRRLHIIISFIILLRIQFVIFHFDYLLRLI